MNIGYFRVSKEDETIQDLERQIKVVQEFFSVEFDKVFKERGSAYNLEKISNRSEFFALVDHIFTGREMKLSDIFYKIKPKDSKINLYVWDYDRIMRNIQLNMLFIVLCDLFDVTIYSYKDGKTVKKDEETPSETFARYMLNSVHAFTGQQYSYAISTNVKKNINRNNGVTSSSYGKKWGRSFTGVNGKTKELTPEEVGELRDFIINEIKKWEKKNAWGYGPKIKKDVALEFAIKISDGYISKLRQEVKNA